MDDQTHIRFAYEAEKLAHLQDGDNAGQAMNRIKNLER